MKRRARAMVCALLPLALGASGCALENPAGLGWLDGSARDTGQQADQPPVDTGTDAGPEDVGVDTGTDTGSDAPVDTGTDAGADTGPDVPDDTGTDAGTDTGTDAGVDAGFDTGVDAGFDTGVDAGFDTGVDTDTGTDTGTDVGVDTGVDAGFDVGVDTGVDAGFDTGTDAGFDAGPPPTPSDTCTSAPALASQPGTYTATGTTASQTNDYSASCNPGSNSDHAGRDVVYRLVLDAPMRVQARVSASGWNPLLYVSRTCDRFSSSSDRRLEGEAACAAGGSSPAVDVTLPPGTYFLVVDGAGDRADNAGAFTLQWTLSAAPGPSGYRLESYGNQSCGMVPMGSIDLGLNDDDETTSNRALAFPFNFFGQTVTRYAVNSNGFVELLPDDRANGTGGGRSWANTPLPNTTAPNGLIAPFWDDLDPDGMSRTRRWLAGSMPNRVEHFRWTETRRYRDGDARLTFEARLYESSGRIEFLYCRLDGGRGGTNEANARGASATVGLESLDATQAFLISFDRATLMPGLLLRFEPIP